MPRLELKQIQKELEQGKLWPVYWVFGNERMKVREIVKRIRKAVLGDVPSTVGMFGMQEERLDGSEIACAQVVESARSQSLGGGLRLIVVGDAHALKDTETLDELLGPPGKAQDLASVCIFLSKDLDARKKFSKSLLEKAAVVPCEDVADEEREAWVQYLAKRKGLELLPPLVLQLCQLDPWTLDIMDQELEKFALAFESSGDSSGEVLLKNIMGGLGGSELFLDSFFSRDIKTALLHCETLAEHPDEALPLLGLFAWNVRQLVLLVRDQQTGSRNAKLNPYVADRLRKWAKSWSLDELLELQAELSDLDFSLKQTPLLPLGLWTSVTLKFRSSESEAQPAVLSSPKGSSG